MVLRSDGPRAGAWTSIACCERVASSHRRHRGDFSRPIATGGCPTDNDGQGPRCASSVPRRRVKRAPRGRPPRSRPRTRMARRQQERASSARTRPTPQCTPLASQRMRRPLRPTVARPSAASRSITVCYGSHCAPPPSAGLAACRNLMKGRGAALRDLSSATPC